MELAGWHLWIIGTILFAIIEIFTPGFLAGSIAVGALLAAIGAVFDAPLALQIILFCTGVLGSFFLIRPFMLRYAHRHEREIRTNGDALLGRTARVSVTIDNRKGEGRVVIDGDDWKAVSEHGTIIPAGEAVKIIRIDSIVLTVEETKN